MSIFNWEKWLQNDYRVPLSFSRAFYWDKFIWSKTKNRDQAKNITILEQHVQQWNEYPKGKQIMAAALTIMIKTDQELVKVYVFLFKDSIPTFVSACFRLYF